VAAGHRTQREPRGRFHVFGVPGGAETGSDRDKFVGREPAQTLAEFLRDREEHGLQQVGRLDAGLHRRASGSPEDPDHLHATLCALGHTRCLAREHRPSCDLCVFGIGFAVAPEVAAFGSLDLHSAIPAAFRWRASPAP
jgi:hypothetical protein